MLIILIAGGISVLIGPDHDTLHFYLAALIIVTIPFWMVSAVASFVVLGSRKIEKTGELKFYDEFVQINNEGRICYMDLIDIRFRIKDYLGQYKYIMDNIFCRPARANGAHNYVTLQTKHETLELRIHLKSKRSFHHLKKELIPFLIRKTAGK